MKCLNAVSEQTDGSSWPTTIHIACVDHGGYWQDVSCPCLVQILVANAALQGPECMHGVAGFNSAGCAAPTFAARVCIRLGVQQHPKVLVCKFAH